MRKIFYLSAMALVCFTAACKKDKKVDPDTTSEADKLKDSLYAYALEDYLWNDQLKPASVFNPKQYTGNSDIEALSNELDALSQVAKNTDGTPYEYYPRSPGVAKYSFVDDGSVSDELGGNAGDYGFEPRYGADGNLYIKYVYPNSPADNAGIKRGYKVTALNGRTTFDPNNTTDINNIITAFYGSSSMNITLQQPDGNSISKALATANYTINPVLKVAVFESLGHKVGYMVFNSFTSMSNSKAKIDAAFNAFTNAGITDLIVDLRYNGGGYVATAEYLVDNIAPASRNNQLMYTYYFNQSLQNNNFTLLKNVFPGLTNGDFKPENNQVKIDKSGKASLALNKVTFIVSGSTASASELTINSLLPYMDVKIFGETSYGKPVGFFAIPIGKYDVYMPEFESRNQLNKANYYQGMVPGSNDFPGRATDDDVTRDFGDAGESCTSAALDYITTGKLMGVIKGEKRLDAARVLSVEQNRDLGIKLEGNKFRGAVYTGTPGKN